MDPRRRRLLAFGWRAAVIAFAVDGWALAAWTVVTGWSGAGYDGYAYWRAGQALLGGTPVYQSTSEHFGAFLYAPPLAVLAIPFGLLPWDLFKVVMLLVNVAALRYVAGSWRWAGIVLLFPWSINELFVGNINFPIAAALYAAFRSTTAPLAIAGLAKLSPFAVVPQLMRGRRGLRPFALTLGIGLAISLPFAGLWPSWIGTLAAGTTVPEGSIPIPFLPRLALALGLIAIAWYRRLDWVAAFAAVVAKPILLPSSLVMLAAPLRLAFDGRSAEAREGTTDAGPRSVDGGIGHSHGAGSLAIILPAFNESARIGPALDDLFGYLEGSAPAREGHPTVAELGTALTVILVDDGSTDTTADIVSARREAHGDSPRLRLLRVPHGGKGAAVRAGMLAADADLVVFADADMATPPDQLPLLIRALSTADVALGSRIHADGSDRRTGQPPYRRFLGRLFHALAAFWVTGPVQDTQCGFKGFRRDAAHDIFGLLRTSSIVFDAEVIYLARRRGYAITAVPVEWSDRRGSRMRPSAALALRVAWDLFRIPLLHRSVTRDRAPVSDQPAAGI